MLLIPVFSALRRAHGSKFFGLVESNTKKRAIITFFMMACCVAASGIFTPWGLLLVPLFWLWLAPGTSIGGVDADKVEVKKAVFRECYAIPAVIFYAFYCGNPWAAFLALIVPVQGLSYYMMRNQSGDKVMKAEFLLGAFMGTFLFIVSV